MITIQDRTVYLVYFNCRGIGQLIRYTLFEIGIDFKEIFVNVNGQLPSIVLSKSINLKNLPCIIHENQVIKEVFPIMKYLCYRFKRLDLLGNSIKSEAQLIEVIYRFQRTKNKDLMIIFRFIKKYLQNPDKIKQIKQDVVKEIKQHDFEFEEACFQLYVNSGTFLFHDLTVLDFIFYEKSFYFCNVFADIAKKKLPLLFAYKNFFEKSQFYLKNKVQIEKYKLMMPQFDLSMNQGFQKLWLGDKNFFHNI